MIVPSNPDLTEYAYNQKWSRLEIINLNAQNSAVKSDRVFFKAFIRSFRDNFMPGWQETQYPNQSVPLAHQSMPKRIIQIEWTVPSANAEEAINNLKKCSWLAQSMYPTLKRVSGNKNYRPKSTFMAIKFANFIQATDGGPLPGYISSFSYTPNLVEGIHILSQKQAPNNKTKKLFANAKGKHLFPNLVDIVMEFKPIQTRDSFGLLEDEGWNNSSWPYGIKIDPQLKVGSAEPSTGEAAKTGTARDVAEANAAKVQT